MEIRIAMLLLPSMLQSREREHKMHARHIARLHAARWPRTECNESCALVNHSIITLHTHATPTHASHDNRGGSQTTFAAERPFPGSLVFANTAYVHEMKGQ